MFIILTLKLFVGTLVSAFYFSPSSRDISNEALPGLYIHAEFLLFRFFPLLSALFRQRNGTVSFPYREPTPLPAVRHALSLSADHTVSPSSKIADFDF